MTIQCIIDFTLFPEDAVLRQLESRCFEVTVEARYRFRPWRRANGMKGTKIPCGTWLPVDLSVDSRSDRS